MCTELLLTGTRCEPAVGRLAVVRVTLVGGRDEPSWFVWRSAAATRPPRLIGASTFRLSVRSPCSRTRWRRRSIAICDTGGSVRAVVGEPRPDRRTSRPLRPTTSTVRVRYVHPRPELRRASAQTVQPDARPPQSWQDRMTPHSRPRARCVTTSASWGGRRGGLRHCLAAGSGSPEGDLRRFMTAEPVEMPASDACVFTPRAGHPRPRR